ncbi:polyphosphate kinase [Catenovulum agarivorans DS-2]|uniref:Polyphosphate kinase n=1 Tax=Catenovulum agarivorans DS-2 TaxID=1328313 RepID=W7QKR1_9ALTE|nr:polyphosphate kinase 1 [Catenovulum agarivorans]EWH09547.1 polyphosphate kinase [Catenovulum agarivorans DS-2]
MAKDKLFVEKELSWLSFNERVLQEAADKTVPVVERVRFLGIFSNNQDEFFRVRVADVRRRSLLEKEHNDERATKLLANIQEKVIALQTKFDAIYKEVVRELARHKIYFVDHTNLSKFHDEWLTNFFQQQVIKHVRPLIPSKTRKLIDLIEDNTTYFAVQMIKGDSVEYAVVEVPTNEVSRFILLPPEKSKVKKEVILLDDVMLHNLSAIFRGFFEFDEINAYSFKMTRDAEYYVEDEIDQSLVEQMSESLKQRFTADPTRVVYDRDMPSAMLKFLKKHLQISDTNEALLPGGKYRNFKDFIGFPNFGRKYLENPKLPALFNAQFSSFDSAFEAIRHQDILLYYPYHTFDHFTELVRQAAFDPAVTSIRLNIYRVAKNSRIIHSLIDAVKNGKNVHVVVELKARFDEENNIEWSRVMTDAGIRVSFGIPTLKIHSKLCLIHRKEGDVINRYAHLGTGNFHEKTAKIYTDFSLFTCHPEITREVENVFDFIEYSYKRYKFYHLLVSPINTRLSITQMIDQEIQNARSGQPSGIAVKVNNLVDEPIIQKLYEASQAGVKIRLIIRGMCSLVPGIKGVSENIKIISIVDRFLEHPRVMVFENGGDKKVYISSADWMTRNIEHRIEVTCPIYDEKLKQRIVDIFELQFKDTTKARVIDAEQKNDYVPRGNRKKLRSQVETYNYIKKLEENYIP